VPRLHAVAPGALPHGGHARLRARPQPRRQPARPRARQRAAAHRPPLVGLHGVGAHAALQPRRARRSRSGCSPAGPPRCAGSGRTSSARRSTS
jgi:hypothetical protein